jgi:hypothetical protein
LNLKRFPANCKPHAKKHTSKKHPKKMQLQQPFKHLSVPKHLDALSFITNFENPFADGGEDDFSNALRWSTDERVLTANSKMVIRQPAHAVRDLTEEQAWRLHARQPFIADEAAFKARVLTTFKNRQTTVKDWHGITTNDLEIAYLEGPSVRSSPSKRILQLRPYGMNFLLGLACLPGLLVAEEPQAQILHFMFDGGQGFISKQSIWSDA